MFRTMDAETLETSCMYSSTCSHLLYISEAVAGQVRRCGLAGGRGGRASGSASSRCRGVAFVGYQIRVRNQSPQFEAHRFRLFGFDIRNLDCFYGVDLVL